jgi:hypothetical protein
MSRCCSLTYERRITVVPFTLPSACTQLWLEMNGLGKANNREIEAATAPLIGGGCVVNA